MLQARPYGKERVSYLVSGHTLPFLATVTLSKRPTQK